MTTCVTLKPIPNPCKPKGPPLSYNVIKYTSQSLIPKLAKRLYGADLFVNIKPENGLNSEVIDSILENSDILQIWRPNGSRINLVLPADLGDSLPARMDKATRNNPKVRKREENAILYFYNSREYPAKYPITTISKNTKFLPTGDGFDRREFDIYQVPVKPTDPDKSEADVFKNKP